jgi:histidine ammonia-lyase
MASFAKLFRFANKLIEEEMNGATDNPLVYFKEDGL